MMLASNFDAERYPEALKRLSLRILYFQANPVFDVSSAPEMRDSGLERLTVEIDTLDLTTLSNLWGILGGRYVPSVLYRVRAVVMNADALIDELSTIRELQPAAGTR